MRRQSLVVLACVAGCFDPGAAIDPDETEGGTAATDTGDGDGDGSAGGTSPSGDSGDDGSGSADEGTTDEGTVDDTDTGSESGSTGGGPDYCGEPMPTLSYDDPDVIDLGGGIGFLYTTDLYGDTGTHLVAVNLLQPHVDLLQNTRLLGSFNLDDTLTVADEAHAAVGDLNGNGSDDIVIASRTTVQPYIYDGNDLIAAGSRCSPTSRSGRSRWATSADRTSATSQPSTTRMETRSWTS